MPQIVAGDAIHVMANFVQPRKPKYMVCACPRRCKYLIVNSDPYLLAPTAQFPLRKNPDAPWLDYDSWLDTSKLVTLMPMETQYVVDGDARCHKGSLAAQLRAAIKAFIGAHGIMPKDQEVIIGANF